MNACFFKKIQIFLVEKGIKKTSGRYPKARNLLIKDTLIQIIDRSKTVFMRFVNLKNVNDIVPYAKMM